MSNEKVLEAARTALPPLPRFRGAPKSASDVLKRTRQLLSNPRRWTQNALSRDRHGRRLRADGCLGGKAFCWCLVGAFWRASGISPWRSEAWVHLEDSLRRWFDGAHAISEFNDAAETDHGKILKLLDAAIDAAKLHEKEGRRESKLNR